MGSIGLSVATDSVRVVKQVVKLRVLPTAAHAAAFEETLRTCNAAASWLSAQMHAARAFRKIDAQHRFYRELRARFGLAAQPAIRVIGKVAESYAGLRANLGAGNYGPHGSQRRRKIEESPIVFRPSAAQPFDARCLSWQFPDDMGRAATDVNHQTSKRIVAEAERTGCGIAVEELTGIRDRVRLRKPQRGALHSWAFAQLGSFLAYKAK
jgi:IS605 OrfB family transposase